MLLRDLNDAKVASAAKISALETKVDTMWAFQMRRAVSEAVTSGVGNMNSPLIFAESAIQAMEPFKARLVNFGKRIPENTTDARVLLEIEREFGEELLKDVCVPFKLSHGACLLLAYQVAMGRSDIDFNSPLSGVLQ